MDRPVSEIYFGRVAVMMWKAGKIDSETLEITFATKSYVIIYYISKLVRALWLVNLVGRTLPQGPLKFRIVCVAKLFRDLSPKFLNLFSK